MEGPARKQKAVGWSEAELRVPTFAERYLWQQLRGQRLEGCGLKRCQVVGKYVADFVDVEKRLVIAIAGDRFGIAGWPDVEKRLKCFRKQGFDVLRFRKQEVIGNIDKVLRAIRKNM
jgi:leucyl-tRNA synthetase